MTVNVKPRISVVGVESEAPTPAVVDLVRRAALVVGGERHLLQYADAIARTAARAALGGDLTQALAAIETATGPVVVLASGDPGFFGIVRTLAERFGRERLHVDPAVSSVALAFARAALPWDDAIVVSAHGRDLRWAVNVALAHPKVAVLTAPGAGPAELAAALVAGLGDASRLLIVAERLGTADERVVHGAPAAITGQQWAEPNVVIVLDESRAVAAKGAVFPRLSPPQAWALDESEFEHRDGMVTKAEVRALALARLGPGPGDLVWDIGAGSGSVAVECARFGAAVIAVDRDISTADRIRANAARHGIEIAVVVGNAAAALADLPDPDAVFIGGSGEEFDAVVSEVSQRARRAVVIALASIERVESARMALQHNDFDVDVVLLQTSRLRAIGALHGFAAANPVFIVSGRRR
jgi:precorrin-6Y C5,15-methyltransferase (decarboxylating)